MGGIYFAQSIGNYSICSAATVDTPGNGKFATIQTTSVAQPGLMDFVANGSQDSQAFPTNGVGIEAPLSVPTPFRMQLPSAVPVLGQAITATANPATNRWSLSFSDVVTPTNIGVRFANNYAGADWCAKAVAADAAIGSGPGEVWVNQSAGTSACATNLAMSANHTLRFTQSGAYTLGTVSILPGDSGGVIADVPGSTQIIYSTPGTSGAPQYMIKLVGAKNVTIRGLYLLGATVASGTDPNAPRGLHF